jgi:adenylate cyclase
MAAGAVTHPPATGDGDGRRLIAVVYADMIGYSRLIGADDAGTFARLLELRHDLIDPALSRHGGTLVNTAGDSLLIRFDSILSAMRFAVEVQRAIPEYDGDHAADQRIRFRMGVNVGDVIPDGTNLHGEGTNIAARLQTVCPSGAICVSRVVRDQVGNRLGLPFKELGAINLKNIGQPVEAFVLHVTPDVAAAIASPRLPLPQFGRRSHRLAVTIAAFILLTVFVSSGAAWMLTRAPPARTPPPVALSPARQQIAILPLLTIGGGDEYFAEGLTEDLIAALGRFPEIAVRGRGAVIAYKDHPGTPGDIGQALAVHYIVEGSVQRAPDRLRVSVRLIGAERGTVLWSETYDADPKDVFAVQDNIAHRVAGALSVRLDTLAVASAVAKPPDRLEAYDLVLRGRQRLDLATRVATSEARALFERAIAMDPNYAAAYVGLGRADIQALEQGWTGDSKGTLARAIASGQKAVALQGDNPPAHAVLGEALGLAGNFEVALEELKRAVALNPSDPEALASYGTVLSVAGDSKSAIPLMEEAARFRPNRPTSEYLVLGLAYILTNRPADAVRIAEQGATGDRPRAWFRVLLAISYAQLGRMEDAAREAADIHRLMPEFDAATFGNALRRPEDRELIHAAIQRANL